MKFTIYIILGIAYFMFRAYQKSKAEQQKQQGNKPQGYGEYNPQQQPQRQVQPTAEQPSLDDIFKELLENNGQVQKPKPKPALDSIPARTQPVDRLYKTDATKPYQFNDGLVPDLKDELAKNSGGLSSMKRKTTTTRGFEGGMTPRKAFLYKELLEPKYF